MPNQSNNVPIIGFDAEWQYDQQTQRNHILSYQFAGRAKGKTWSGIIYTKGAGEEERLSMAEFFGKAIEAGREQGALGRQWPKEVYAAAHFSRADLSAFKDFKNLTTEFDGLRKTFATLRKPHKVTVYDKSRNKHELKLFLLDTLLLTPGQRGLAVVGGMLGYQKLELPDGAKDRMGDFLANAPAKFETYAIRDAEISALHAERMVDFATNELGQNDPPVTLSSLATKRIEQLWQENGIDRLKVLGKEKHASNAYSKTLGKKNRKTEEVWIDTVHENIDFATECYHGGRNEAYIFGFTGVYQWYDYDLPGAYSTAMAAIKMPDFGQLRHSEKLDDFTHDVLGLAKVKFRFPDGTAFPCLPVRTENGLVFPLQGKAYVGSPEIALARQMDCEIEIQRGVIVPWADEVRPFELFVKNVQAKRKEYEKGSLYELTWKEIGNSLYGKLAQGLRKKRVYDPREQDSKELPPSRVTQPFLAAYVTSLVRAVVGQLLEGVPGDKLVASATTDGFLTNAEASEIRTSGPLCSFFADLRERLSGDRTVLEEKHRALQLLCWKTRGQVGVNLGAGETDPVLAKAGIKPPDDAIRELRDRERENVVAFGLDPNELATESEDIVTNWIARLFLERTPQQKLSRKSLISMREMIAEEADMVPVFQDTRLNMEYDWKRRLTGVVSKQAPIPASDGYHEHISARSVPWDTVDDFKRVRSAFDEWRAERCLKTYADWTDWQKKLAQEEAATAGVRRREGGLPDSVVAEFVKAYAKGMWGLRGARYADAVAALKVVGIEKSVNDFKNAKRSKQGPKAHAFHATPEVLETLGKLQAAFPEFDTKILLQEKG